MSRKEKIAELETLIKNLEASTKYKPTTDEEFRDFDRKVQILDQTKKELRELLYTSEEIKFQNGVHAINLYKGAIQKLNTSLSVLFNVHVDNRDFTDIDSKSRVLRDFQEKLKAAQDAIIKDYYTSPLQMDVMNLDSNFCEVSFKYGSETQKRAIKEMFDLILIDEYGSLSEVAENGYYIQPYLVDELGEKTTSSDVVGGVKIPKDLAYEVLNQLVSVPASKMKIGKKVMTSKVDYNDIREELGMVQPLEATVDLFERGDNYIDWKISLSYDSRSQVEKIYNAFENKYVPELGANSPLFEELGVYIKPSLAEDSIYGYKQIDYVIVPGLMLHIMLKHLIEDEGVAVNIGNQRFEGIFDNNSINDVLQTLLDEGPKL